MVQPRVGAGVVETCYADFAKIYDPLMGGRYVSAWWRWFKTVLEQERLQPRGIADLACGTGEAALRLSRKGKPMLYLVDRSQGMLDQARLKLPQAQLLCQDMTALQLPQAVDLAVCIFGGLNYLSTIKEVESFFLRVHSQLKPGGIFFVDAATPFFLKQHFAARQEVFRGDTWASFWSSTWSAEQRQACVRVDSYVRKGRCWQQHCPEVHRHWAFEKKELLSSLRRAGFSRMRTVGLPENVKSARQPAYWGFLARAPLTTK